MWGSNLSGWGSNFCGFGPSFGHGSWFVGWLLPTNFWGVILYLAYTVIKSIFTNNTVQQNDSALEILRNRFASGEISEEEYTAQKVILNKN